NQTFRSAILNGKLGEVQHPPIYPWTFLDNIVLNPHPKYKQLKTLELKPPKKGKTWQSTHHQQEFELVLSAFKFFLGVEGSSQFKLESIVLLHNEKLESEFRHTYNVFANRSKS